MAARVVTMAKAACRTTSLMSQLRPRLGTFSSAHLTTTTTTSGSSPTFLKLSFPSTNKRTMSSSSTPDYDHDKPPKFLCVHDDNPKELQITWTTGLTTTFPAVWFRDNCQCTTCFHPSSFNRLIQMTDLDLDIQIKDVRMIDDYNIEIEWPDGHLSRFDAAWLHDRLIRTKQYYDLRRTMSKRGQQNLWNGTFINSLRRHKFQDVIHDDRALFNFLTDLDEYGLVFVEEMHGRGRLTELMAKIGVTKLTHYGKEFEVMAKPDANNAAYTPLYLSPHVDLPYYNYGPGLQLLHCIRQTLVEGGENTFVDGFYLEKLMREGYPEDWKLLKEEELQFFDVGVDDISGDFHKINHTPVFRYGHDGQLMKVTFNNASRDSHLHCDTKKIVDLYRAMKTFCVLATDPANKITYKLQEGECVIVDNHRVLHGRASYKVQAGGGRLLHGGYIDWDEARSRTNVLREKFRKEKLKKA